MDGVSAKVAKKMSQMDIPDGKDTIEILNLNSSMNGIEPEETH